MMLPMFKQVYEIFSLSIFLPSVVAMMTLIFFFFFRQLKKPCEERENDRGEI